MSENIRSINLNDNEVMTSRDVTSNNSIFRIDINQMDGSYAAVEPYGSDSSYNGRVVIYPQSPIPEAYSQVILQTFDRVGSLYYPIDAKFDYLRRKIWIADTGNNRVLKVNLNTQQVDLNIDENLIYPNELAIDLNTGNIFIKAYETYDLTRGAIYFYKSDGSLLSTFLFNRTDTEESSSSSSGSVSSSSSSYINSQSSSSSSGDIILPTFSSRRTMIFDHVRSRLWWVDSVRIYVLDIRNKQIQTYDIRSDSTNHFTEALSINIEFSTGNAFVIVKNFHEDRYLIQMSRDNNSLLGIAYIQE